MLRFVNDLGVYNVKSFIVPWENKWTVFYKALTDIAVDE